MPTSLEAVAAAVRGEAPPVETPPAAAETPPAPEPVEAVAGEPAAAAPGDLVGQPPAEPAAAEPAAPVQPVVDEQGRMRGPDGKFVAATPAAAPATPPAAAATPPVTPPVVPPKALDPVNDPPPPNAKPETRERITTLANMVKERDTQLTQANEDLELLQGHIREANASAEQFKESMQLVGWINSPHQHERMQALQYLQGAAHQLAEELGVVLPGSDALEGFADLQRQSQANPALRPMLEETARLRRQTAATQNHQQQTLQSQQAQRARNEAAQRGQAAIREVEQGFAEIDPGYAAKIAIMRADTAFVAQLRRTPPEQWAAAFSKQYRSIKLPAAAPTPAPAPVTPAAPPPPTPLRARTPAGSQGRPPATSLEAVTAAIRAG